MCCDAAAPGSAGAASLPMYDLPELRGQTDALWSFIAGHLRREGIAAPEVLIRGVDLDTIWTDPGLLLAQTCGYPLVTTLKGRVELLTTPSYSAPGCTGPNYRSAIIVRAAQRATCLADMRGSICAVNGSDSNSGMNILRAAIAPLARDGPGFFRKVTRTGGHAASVRAVARGGADLAAIDCVTWAHLQRLRPAETGGLRVLCWSDPSPGLPLITSTRTDAATRHAVTSALDRVVESAAMAPVRAALLLTGFCALPLATYDTVFAAEQNARELGYPHLR